ncbi:unnamed protein product [Diabrotica balteata]|uniref:Uncharacterized protein n=1 Tax=Diabrotica balteata TaxID=107213 RepID=A0A9N9T0N7_DIABA|nr:unnamed protein product [Diabrotica balteata]
MNLQAVKLCPYVPANKMYFKTKLSCYNFTVYNLKTHDVMCYWFSENENNQLKASTFVSYIIHCLEENCVTDFKTLVLIYSEECGYQNRNNVLANALLNFAIKHNVLVFEKYLEPQPGHSQMECDSVHSMIEKNIQSGPPQISDQDSDERMEDSDYIPSGNESDNLDTGEGNSTADEEKTNSNENSQVGSKRSRWNIPRPSVWSTSQDHQLF